MSVSSTIVLMLSGFVLAGVFCCLTAVYLRGGVYVRGVGGGAVGGTVGGALGGVAVNDDDDDDEEEEEEEEDIVATENFCLPGVYTSTIYISRIVFLSTVSVYGLFLWLLMNMDYF